MTNDSAVALVDGAACSIGREVAAGLARQGVRVVLRDEAADEPACSELTSVLQEAGCEAHTLTPSVADDEIGRTIVEQHGRLDYLFNCLAPTSKTTAGEIFGYPQRLHKRTTAAAAAMVACGSKGAIVSQYFTGSLFAGSPLEVPLMLTKGGISGVTRQICCAFGKNGIRINAIQAGLTEMPENEGLVSPETRLRKTPVGRWAAPAEIAKFMLFLALRNGYMTGQVIVMDGGLTAGNTGT